MEGFTQANLFELSRGAIHVTYSTTSILGGPILNYHDNQISRSFRGEEIRILDTEAGQLITVTLEAIPDLRTVTFSLILSTVTVMPQSTGTRISVPGITTTAPTTIAGPPPGPQQLYSIVRLRGTAQFIVS
ncbi:hypothetical protein [Nitrosospira sp. NpAV]|uniref:hypothetical protein n=1 Tax=Nitrosospira sp. NpAV TaxID=58133 RepID=UPI0006988970|nr:hypothetical protein [Nitrosospira sp. NpAV]